MISLFCFQDKNPLSEHDAVLCLRVKAYFGFGLKTAMSIIRTTKPAGNHTEDIQNVQKSC